MYTQFCLGLRLELINQEPKLTGVPVGFPTDFTELYLRDNEIAKIGADNFTRLSSVVIMDLSSNRITQIDDHAVLPCDAFSELRLSNNRLSSLPETHLIC